MTGVMAVMVTASALPLSPLMGLFSLDGLDVDDWYGDGCSHGGDAACF